MSSAELTEWLAFDRIDPIGDDRADARAGVIAAVAANYISSLRSTMVAALTGQKIPAEERMPSEFMLFRERPAPPPPKEITPEEQSRAIKRLLGVKDE